MKDTDFHIDCPESNATLRYRGIVCILDEERQVNCFALGRHRDVVPVDVISG